MKKAGTVVSFIVFGTMWAFIITSTSWIWFQSLPRHVYFSIAVVGACLSLGAGLLSISFGELRRTSILGTLALGIAFLLLPAVFTARNWLLIIFLPGSTLLATFFLLQTAANRDQQVKRMFIPLAVSFLIIGFHSFVPWSGLHNLLAGWTYVY